MSELKVDPKSKKFDKCPSGTCDGTDIRVHFTKDNDGNPTNEEDHLHWCVKCGIGYNAKRGPYCDAMVFGSCVEQMTGR